MASLPLGAQVQRVTPKRDPSPAPPHPCSSPGEQGSPTNFHLKILHHQSKACKGDSVGSGKGCPRESQERGRSGLTPSLGNFSVSSWVKWDNARFCPPTPHGIPHSSSHAWLTEEIIQKTLRLCPRNYNSVGRKSPWFRRVL